MNVNDVYGSNWLKASDLNGKTYQLTIVSATVETIADRNATKRRIALKLATADGVLTRKSLLLNRVNAAALSGVYGPEVDAWRGRIIELYPDQVVFGNGMVPALRVRVPPESIAAAPSTSVPTSGPGGGF